MQYTSDAPPVRSLDVEGTETANVPRYRSSTDEVYLNPDGLPIAFRRVRVLKPGTFAGARRVQLVSPRGITSLSLSVYRAYRGRCHPAN
jgi:hypothetical protein